MVPSDKALATSYRLSIVLVGLTMSPSAAVWPQCFLLANFCHC